MQSVIRPNHLLFGYNKCFIKHVKRWGRTYRPLIVDKPPDFYQTIEQKLNQINYFETAKHLIDIGFNKESDIRNKWTEVRKVAESVDKYSDKELEDYEELEQTLNYNRIYDKWLLSEEGIESIIDLANHYAIFRDLFPPKPQLQSISSVEDIPPKPIYFFSPLVPIKAEFCINESDIEDNDINGEQKSEKSNDLIYSPVFRGNILLPQKCINCPNVTIDSSAINGINNLDNSVPNNELSDELSGQIRLLNDNSNYYTLCLFNLDSHFGDESNVCHWMTTNIQNKNGVTNCDTVVKYLPVYGIRGLGYHRFVFLLYKHKNPLNLEKINDFDLKKRKFNAFEFMSAHGLDNSLTPVGLSWFQTIWDYSSQKIFFDYLDMRSPHYEWMSPKEKEFKQIQFPGRAPFNLYLDNFRDPKDIAKDVLLERLKSVHPYNYEKQFEKTPNLPHIYPFPKETPDWLKASIRKRRSKLGVFRGLRPHSAIEPNDNNADLDQPKWPRIHESKHPLNQPIPYPDGHRRPKPLRDTLWAKPPNEHPTYRIYGEDTLPEEDKKNIRKKE